MKQIIRTISLVAVLSGFATATHATTVWSQNFDSLALGPYGAHTTDFIGGASPSNNIVAPGNGGGQAMAFTYNTVSGTSVNIQTATLEYAASGNTSANLSDYTLSFDLAIQGVDPVFNQGMEVGVFGTGSWIFNGDADSFMVTSANLPTAGSGYRHFSLPLSTFHADTTALIPTDSSFSVGFGVVNYGNTMTASPETLLVDNAAITMVPEPSTFAMLLGGLGLFAGWRRYRRVS